MTSFYVAIILNNVGLCCYFINSKWIFGIIVTLISIAYATYKKILVDNKYSRSI